MEPPREIATSDELTYDSPDDLETVRRFVRLQATAAGLADMKAQLLALAVSELVTNTLLYTSEGGRVLLSADEHAVFCEVHDRGDLASRPLGREMPPPGAVRGRGLAIVRQVCDAVTAHDTPGGAMLRLTMLK